jgi:YfiR/HmsC-like
VPRLGLTLILLFVPGSVSAQASVPAEYRAKASFLATFPSFIDWPESAFLSAQAPFLVCVLGDFRFGTALAESARSASPHGRLVDVRWVRRDREARNCQILFVSESEAKRYAGILQAVQGRGILTVGETMDFLSAGGMLSFSFQNGTLQFDVNLAAANEAHLRVSSRLLVLARRVLNNPESSDGYTTALSASRKVD